MNIQTTRGHTSESRVRSPRCAALTDNCKKERGIYRREKRLESWSGVSSVYIWGLETLLRPGGEKSHLCEEKMQFVESFFGEGETKRQN